MAYETNRFCWHGLVSTDTDRAAAFYPEVLGWKVQSMPMGDETATMFVTNDVPVAHFMAPQVPEMPSHWNNYLRVEDVAASTRAAVEAGGKEIHPPTDIPPGCFSVVESPSGAKLSLFHEADPSAEHHPGGLGGVHWVELRSQSIDADLAWLKSVFNYETSEMPMPQGGTYYLLNHGGEMRGGAMASFMEGAPSMWLTWFSVDNADGALDRIQRHGGKVYSPAMDMEGVGRMAVVADNTGAAFGVIQPKEQG